MADTQANQFFSDPRVLQAKRLIKEALVDIKSHIVGVQPPKQELKLSYQKLLDRFKSLRGSALWYPYVSSGLGNGALVELQDGSVKYDFISGIGAHFSHSDEELLMASVEGALQDTVMQGNLQQNQDSCRLMDVLIKESGMDHIVLSTSGAMANENALKIIFQHQVPAQRLLAFEKCFMGRTLAAAQLTDKPQYREGLPLNLDVDYIPFFDHEDPQGSTKRAVDTLKKTIKRYPKQHAAMCFELIQGEAGFYPGTTAFFKALMNVLKKADILVFVDEVQTFGRTSSLFAYQTLGLEEYVDIVSLGKLAQICATMYRKKLNPRPGLVSQTFTSSSSAIHSSLFVLNSLLTQDYLGETGKNMMLSNYLREKLDALVQKHPNLISGPFGMGTMIACTLFGGNKDSVIKFTHALYNNGVIGFVAGAEPTRLRFLLPIGGIKEKDIDAAMQIFEKTLESFI